jgi:hypothetical protein
MRAALLRLITGLLLAAAGVILLGGCSLTFAYKSTMGGNAGQAAVKLNADVPEAVPEAAPAPSTTAK